MTRLEDEQTCSKCGNQFDRIFIGLENGETMAGRWDNMIKNVKNHKKNGAEYLVEIECPKCWHREWIEK